MQCPRLDHFVRFNPNGTVSRCGHMVNPPQFNSLQEMESSQWLSNIRNKLWADECVRCKETESLHEDSIRIHTIRFHQSQTVPDYLMVGGVLDNICNSGCLTCNENHSTKIGSLKSRVFPIVNNTNKFWNLPLHRIVHLDINGGEPSASKNYRSVLKNLPKNIKSVRINTNCSIIIDEIEELIDKAVKVTVTVSLDGIGDVHDFVRWPIKWDKFYENLMYYKSLKGIELNTWTTVSSLNISNFEEIVNFVNQHEIDHSYALLHRPDVLNIRYQNIFTLPYKNRFPGLAAIDTNNQHELDKFIEQQSIIRGVN
jgi:sulfatase maturation enzyme AslB (radical SAM superfamily)